MESFGVSNRMTAAASGPTAPRKSPVAMTVTAPTPEALRAVRVTDFSSAEMRLPSLSIELSITPVTSVSPARSSV